MEYAALAFLWLGFVCLLLWRGRFPDKRKAALFRRCFLACVFLFLASLFIWNYCFR